MPIEMRHLIILVPGLMGSVLEKEGQGQIWGLSGQALWQYLRTLGGSLQSLRVANDDWQVDDLGDGIQGTQIIQFRICSTADHSSIGQGQRRLIP